MELTERLAQARRARGLSQAEAAERLNVSRQAISRWETGIGMPTLDNLIQMGKLYQVSLDELVYGSRPETQPAQGKAAEETGPVEGMADQPEATELEQRPKRRRPALRAALALGAAGMLALGIWGGGLLLKDRKDPVGSVIIIGGTGQELDKLPLDRAGEQVGPFVEVEPVEQELGVHLLEDTQYRSGSNFERDLGFISVDNARYLSITVTNNGVRPLLFRAGHWEQDRQDMLSTQIPAGATVTRTFEVLESSRKEVAYFGVDISTGSAGGTMDIQISAVNFKR